MMNYCSSVMKLKKENKFMKNIKNMILYILFICKYKFLKSMKE